MKKLDKILAIARKAAIANYPRFFSGFVEPDASGGYVAIAHLRSDAPGKAQTIVTNHESKEEAEAALQKLADKYPNAFEKPIIIIDDLEPDEP
jgi:hypothetical protein